MMRVVIGNVLSLKNSLNLSSDIPEVSQEKLLSLVAERLIDSNSNIDVIALCTIFLLCFLFMKYCSFVIGRDVFLSICTSFC